LRLLEDIGESGRIGLALVPVPHLPVHEEDVGCGVALLQKVQRSGGALACFLQEGLIHTRAGVLLAVLKGGRLMGGSAFG